jgi:hypothetical protein
MTAPGCRAMLLGEGGYLAGDDVARYTEPEQ